MNKITIISGQKQSGKTTYLVNFLKINKADGNNYEGFVALGTFKNGVRNSFSLINISTNDEMLFMNSEPISNAPKQGKFYINPEGIAFGENILKKALNSDCKGVVIDEIGPLELNNEGWAGQFKLLLNTDKEIVITVRTSLIQRVISFFELKNFVIIRI
ncbi:MAG: hypothetical protein KKG99_05610 [Bacteroidetes bacterium]|nr:hypothetical protein [Bacteroidota bacterium]